MFQISIKNPAVFDSAVRKIKASDKAKGIVLMVVASFCFSIMGACSKTLVARLPIMEIVFFRAFVSFLLLIPWMRSKKISFLGRNRLGLMTRGICGCVAIGFSFYAISKIDLAQSAMLNYTSPIFVALLAFFFLKERPSVELVFCIVLAFVGAAFIVKPGTDLANLAGLAGLLAGFFSALAYVSIKKLHATDAPATMVFYFAWITSVVAACFLPIFVMPNVSEFGILLATGFFGTIAQLIMTESYKYASATVVSPFSFSGVLFSGFWGLVLWNEVPDTLSLLGGLLIVSCGIGIVRLRETKAAPVLLKTAS